MTTKKPKILRSKSKDLPKKKRLDLWVLRTPKIQESVSEDLRRS